MTITVPAWAQATSVHATGSVSLAYTDNMLGAATEPAPNEQGPMPVAFTEIVPGAVLYHDSPRMRLSLAYNHPLTIYFGHMDANDYADNAEAHSMFALSPRDELSLGLTATRSSTRLDALQRPPQAAPNAAQLVGQNILLSLGLSQGYSRELSARWSFHQDLTSSTVVPLDVTAPQGNLYLLRLGSGVDYVSGHNAYGLLGHASYLINGAYGDAHNEVVPAERQVLLGSLFRWRRDLTPTWSSELAGGVTGAVRPSDLHANIWAAVGQGALRYDFDHYSAQFAIQRQVAPDLITGQTYLSDQARISGGVPIHRQAHIIVHGGTFVGHSRVVNVDQRMLTTTFNAWGADAELGWYPEGLPAVSLRVQHYEQTGHAGDVIPAITFHRNTVMVNVAWMWPQRRMQEVPTGPPQRVDGADRDPTAPGNDTQSAQQQRQQQLQSRP